MKTVFFMNSNEYISSEDRELFRSIVGTSIEFLETQIKKLHEHTISRIYSNEKFVDIRSLNELGLHLYRIILANKIYKKRGPVQSELGQQFYEQGYLLVEDFLPEEEFNNIKSVFDRDVASSSAFGTKWAFHPTQMFARNKNFYDLIKECARVKNFSHDAPKGIPRTEFWNHFHDKEDPQYRYHTDTFQPTCKFWLYLEDIEVNQGPMNLIPSSHVCDEKRLKWDYENSLLTRGSTLWGYRVQKNGNPGSFRILEGSTEEEERSELQRLGYSTNKIMVGKKNTLLAANTYCFHKRGIGEKNSHRRTLTSQYRPLAFGDY